MRRKLCSVVTASAALLAVACALGPDYQRPKEKIPAAYRFEPAAGNDSFADQGWWQLYQDPTLQSLIREALDNNLAARIDQARAILGSTRLQQLPQISASADAQRARTSVGQRIPGVPAISNVFLVDGSLSYEFDFWGKYRRAPEATRAGLLASQYAQQDVMAGLDVATAQAQLAIAQANIPELQRQIGISEDQLSVLLGRNPDQILRTESSQLKRMIEPAIPPVPPAGLPSSLLERRPDLREAEQNLVAANANVGVAKANLFPTITLTAAGGHVSTALSDLFSGPTRAWTVGAGLLQPLLSSQRNLYQLELTDAQKRQALLQ